MEMADSEDENEAAPSQHGQEEEEAQPSDDRGYNDATAEGGAKRQRLALLQNIFGLAKAKRIIERIEDSLTANAGTGLHTGLRASEQSGPDSGAKPEGVLAWAAPYRKGAGLALPLDGPQRPPNDVTGSKTQSCGRRNAPADEWEKAEQTWSRVHLRPRAGLFTPLRVEGSPPARSLFSVRVTQGCFCDSGEQFTRVDAWPDRRTAHMPMRALWTGTTTFVLKPQLISSAVQCSRAERGSESCGLVYNRCPSIERIKCRSRDTGTVHWPKGSGTVPVIPATPCMYSLCVHNHSSHRDSCTVI